MSSTDSEKRCTYTDSASGDVKHPEFLQKAFSERRSQPWRRKDWFAIPPSGGFEKKLEGHSEIGSS